VELLYVLPVNDIEGFVLLIVGYNCQLVYWPHLKSALFHHWNNHQYEVVVNHAIFVHTLQAAIIYQVHAQLHIIISLVSHDQYVVVACNIWADEVQLKYGSGGGGGGDDMVLEVILTNFKIIILVKFNKSQVEVLFNIYAYVSFVAKLVQLYACWICDITFIFWVSVDFFVILHVYTAKFIFNAQVFVVVIVLFGMFLPFVVTCDLIFVEFNINIQPVNGSDVIILGIGII